MPEPVICPGCGASYGDYPAEGKCEKCGAAIPAPARTGKGIDDELARMSGPARTCPTCGKPIPPGKKSCPSCRAAEAPRERHGMPGWVALVLVLVFAAIATTVTVIYTKKWGQGQHQGKVKEYIADARKALKEGKYSDANIRLDTARDMVNTWFEEDDPERADLATEVDQVRKTLRQAAEDKVRDMIQKGEELEAQGFYDSDLKEIDKDKGIAAMLEKALKNRTTMLHYRTAIKDAQKSHDESQKTGDMDKLKDALQAISDLRTEAMGAKGVEMVAIRTQVEGLQKAWVTEAYDLGMKALQDGKIADARKYIDMAQQYVSPNDGALRRKIEDTRANVSENRVMGLVVRVNNVRMGAKPDEVKADLVSRLRTKAEDEGVLTLVLNDRNDPRGAELTRILTADYDEQKGGSFQAAGKKLSGTKVTCTLKIVSTKDGKTVWQEKDPVVGDTPKTAVPADSTDVSLRTDAVRRFFVSLDAVRIPARDMMP